ncbi:hypothetical protein V2G26_008574 [Clonostachys chloroleuca]
MAFVLQLPPTPVPGHIITNPLVQALFLSFPSPFRPTPSLNLPVGRRTRDDWLCASCPRGVQSLNRINRSAVVARQSFHTKRGQPRNLQAQPVFCVPSSLEHIPVNQLPSTVTAGISRILRRVPSPLPKWYPRNFRAIGTQRNGPKI